MYVPVNDSLDDVQTKKGYFHSKEQLIELANRIWVAAYEKGMDDAIALDRDGWPDPKILDQTTFINSLFEKE
jgi:hypothetical protein